MRKDSPAEQVIKVTKVAQAQTVRLLVLKATKVIRATKVTKVTKEIKGPREFKGTKVKQEQLDQTLFSLLMKILLLHITFQITRLTARIMAARCGIRLTSTTS